MEKLLKRLGIELPVYSKEIDPTKQIICDTEWTIPSVWIKEMEKLYSIKLKAEKRKKSKKFFDDFSNDKKLKTLTKQEQISE